MTSLSFAQLFTHSTVNRGGAVQGLLLVRGLQNLGHRVIPFFHASFCDKGREFRETYQPFAESDLNVRRINMKNPLNYLFFRRWLQKEKVDIIHTHRSLALLFAYFSTAGLTEPILVASRGTTYPFSNPLVRHVFHSPRLKQVVAVSHAVEQTLIEEEGVDSRKIRVVYGSYDEKRFYPGVNGTAIREEFQISAETPLVVCVAAIDPRKGLHFLFRAAAQMTKEAPTVMFLIVGNIENFHYYQDIQKERERLGLQGRVIIAGHRNDVPEILATANVSVNASTEGEGLTGALRESLAMQTPVVCTAVCGNPELIQDGKSGWVVKPTDVRALAHALLEALRNPQEAKRRAREGYRRVISLCANEVRCRQIESVYFSLHQPPCSFGIRHAAQGNPFQSRCKRRRRTA